MMLTGAITINPGAPAQLVAAIFIVLFDLLLQLKSGPYKNNTDDILSFLASIQLLGTLIIGLFITSATQTREDEKFGVFLVLLNSIVFVALFISLLPKRWKVNDYLSEITNDNSSKMTGENNRASSGELRREDSTKIVPVITNNTKQNDDLKNWNVTLRTF